MNCPRCGAALDDSHRCETCQLDCEQVEPQFDPEERLASLGVVRDPALLPVLQSLLTAEGIRSMVTNETGQDFLGWGRVVAGPSQLIVRESDAVAARELLLHQWPAGDSDELDTGAAHLASGASGSE